MSMVVLLLLVLVVICATGRERRTRRAFAEDGPTFRCRVRSRRRWSRWMLARWTGELLVIRRGPVFDRIRRLPGVVLADGVVRRHVHGRRLIVVRVGIGGGAVIEVAADGLDRAELVGPYVAAAFSGLAAAPVRRRHEN
ncbi:hypothetical protein Acy02nite_51770 [Actinoplanes cyaneus]|uniref:Uncharacterized protein n=1 Tax=Actinoplanes cyaneus TaxID=52696 RepID=A0A919MDL9_9ACTN|nr:hypothetical protein [Actinoplanes cyaneus]MCW2141227.1 hypothetical protein [Actinoplanes cyaneus]GID67296.1 hypothetical protein Acy02nite_51770 [Actinoplanes cyaneus]